MDQSPDTRRLARLFNETVRADPTPRPWMSVTHADGVVRLGGSSEFIIWWTFAADAMEAAVATQAARVATAGIPMTWRVYDFDAPAGLNDALRRAGFAIRETGTLMVMDLSTAPSARPGPDGVSVARVADLDGLDDFSAAAALAFGEDRAEQRAEFAQRLDDPDLALYVARIAGAPAGSGRLETGWGEAFGYMFTGGVVPAHRGKGVYRALVDARIAHARRRGLKYLATEARETSRPILETIGFIPVARQTTWRLSPTEPQ